MAVLSTNFCAKKIKSIKFWGKIDRGMLYSFSDKIPMSSVLYNSLIFSKQNWQLGFLPESFSANLLQGTKNRIQLLLEWKFICKNKGLEENLGVSRKCFYKDLSTNDAGSLIQQKLTREYTWKSIYKELGGTVWYLETLKLFFQSWLSICFSKYSNEKVSEISIRKKYLK